MPSFKVTLSYDGTDFVGWQRQASGTSIQGLLEAALRELDGRAVTVLGAGRTDAGVHALEQVAAFFVERSIECAALVRALNAQLPADVRVLTAAEVPPAFHPRIDARAKTYRYRIWNGEVMSPFERRYAWHVGGALDVDSMAAAARILEGRHDFAAFQASGSETSSTEREITTSGIDAHSKHSTTANSSFLRVHRGGEVDVDVISYEITGDGFLRHMVRNIVGTLVEIGRGRRTAESMGDVLASRNREMAGPTAPPQGLFLVSVAY